MSFFYKNRGVITVFVTLIMVPIVVFTGTMVDLARLKLYSSLAVVTADGYGEAVLSEYDNVLKEMYGLFSVTQSEDGKKTIEKYAKQAAYAFNPNGDDGKLSGFMPYKNATVKVSHSAVEGATLSNPNVLLSQISAFMKFRAAQELLSGDNPIFEAIEQISGSSDDMNAVSQYNKLAKELSESLDCISDYYKTLQKLKAYPDYIETLSGRVTAYNNALKGEFKGDNYKKFYNYLQNKSAIDAAVAKKNNGKEKLTEQEKGLCNDDFDENAYRRDTLGKLSNQYSYPVRERELTGINVTFSTVQSLYDKLFSNAGKLEAQLDELKAKVDELNSELDKCSDDLKQSMKSEIADVEKILDYKGKFIYVAQQLEKHDIIKLNKDNSSNMDACESKLDNSTNGLYVQLYNASLKPDAQWSDVNTDFSWWDFYTEDTDAHTLYDSLDKICSTTSGAAGDKNAADKKKKAAADKESEAVAKMEDDSDEKGKRDIPDDIAKQLETDSSKYSVPGVIDYFNNSSAFKALGSIGTQTLDKLLLITYDFGMFSSRVTNVKTEDNSKEAAIENIAETNIGTKETDKEETNENTDDTKEYEMSLTGIPLSSGYNYLYGAELEYLYSGKTSSADNLKSVRNMICAVRMALNYISTYTIKELNATITNVSNSAAEAVAATGVGAPFAPIVKVAVSGALRAAFAGCETALDWKMLKERKKVVVQKKKLSQLNCIDELTDLIGDIAEDNNNSGDNALSGDDDKALSLSYEEYVWVMLLLMVDSDNLTKRTGNLITLNVNYAQTDDELTKLDFKLSDTVTAVKATCSIKDKFVIAPKGFMQMFLKDNKTQSELSSIEDEAYSYSVIRGY